MFDAFFDNIGGKIKKVAIICFIIGCSVSGIAALATLFGEGEFWAVLLILTLGPIASWLSCFLLYGFGELVESSSDNRKLLASIAHNMSQNKQYLAAIANKTTVTQKATPKPAVVKPVATYAPAPVQPASTQPAPTPAAPAPVQPAPTPAAAPAPATVNPTPVQPVATQATDLEKEKLYLYGVQMFERRSYQVAYNIFSKIPDYKNVNVYLEQLKSLL